MGGSGLLAQTKKKVKIVGIFPELLLKIKKQKNNFKNIQNVGKITTIFTLEVAYYYFYTPFYCCSRLIVFLKDDVRKRSYCQSLFCRRCKEQERGTVIYFYFFCFLLKKMGRSGL